MIGDTLSHSTWTVQINRTLGKEHGPGIKEDEEESQEQEEQGSITSEDNPHSQT